MAAQTGLCDAGNVLTVDQNAPPLRIVKAEQQPRDGALASARWADNRIMLTSWHSKAKVVQNRPVAFIAEADILKSDRRLLNDKVGRIGRIFHLDIGVNESKHLRHINQPLADRAIDPAQKIERTEKLHEIGVHKDEVANRQLALAPSPHAVSHCASH